MVEAGRHREGQGTARPAADAARLPDFTDMLAMNPLMANQAAAMVAATTIGFGIANQMAGVFFGAVQTMMEQANRANAPAEAHTGKAAAKPAVSPEPVTQAPAKAASAPKVKAATAKAKPVAAGKAPAKPRAAKAAKPAEGVATDLKTISGIGPKIEKVLNEKGVKNLAEVAAWSAADIARFDKELGFDGRIARDDWVGQAQVLLK